jgi:internalin A
MTPLTVQQLIAQAAAEQWEELDLSGMNLLELPPEIGTLRHLKRLRLGKWDKETKKWAGNQLTALPETIGNLHNLKYLDLNHNQLTAIPETIGNLHNLSSLSIWNNQLTAIPEVIGALHNLTNLYLKDNQLTAIPETIGNLHNLKYLIIWNNQLTAIPETIGNLHNLKYLNLSDNQLTVIPEVIGNLHNLTDLGLSDNQLTAIPETIETLFELENLNLSNNKIQALPVWIRTLPLLKQLDLRGNPIPIPNFILGSKSWWEESGDLQTILQFYFQTQDPKERSPLYEAKLLIVGEGEAGKTTLAKKLQDLDFEVIPGQDSTEGIDVIRWEFEQPNAPSFRTNIWDFGGQEIYHQTHQFFLTERSLYLLVVDDRRENPNFYYWLNVIRVLSDNSPVLVIQNEKNNNKCNINTSELRGEFDNLERFFNLNFATDRPKFQELQKYIQHRITQLPQVREDWPKSWVNIRHALENYAQNQNYIGLDEYKNLCRNNHITDVAEMLQISKALHELGICLHFQTVPALKHQIILKPEWVTNAVYKVVKNEDVIARNGCFTTENLKALWNHPEYAEVQDELLALMQKFNLCYPLIGSPGTYIAPQILPNERPEDINIDFANGLTLTYRYEFMPKGLVAPFIVGMYRLIAQNQRFVWRNGVILHDNDAYAEVVESYYNREIQIRVIGYSQRSLLDRIRQKFWEIHATYDDRLKFEELIPCNCSQCANSKTPQLYALKTLERRLYVGRQYTVNCEKSFEDVNIRNLISDFPEINPNQPPESDEEERFARKAYEDMREIAKLGASRETNFNLKQEQTVTTEKNQIWTGDRVGGDKVMGDKDTVAGNKMRTGDVAGDAIAGNKIVNSQNLTQAAKEIQDLLDQLSATEPSLNPNLIADKAIEAIKKNPTLKDRIINAGKEAGFAALDAAVSHPAIKIVTAAIKGALDA